TDSFPALALGVEKGDEDIMHVSPRNPNEPILDKEMVYSIISQSLAITTATLVAYFYGMYHYPNHIEGARTVAFFTLITAELLRSYSVRSSRFTLFHIGVFSNKTLVYGTTLSFFMMLVVVYVPFLQPYFDTVSLGIKELAVAIPLAFLPFIVAEVSKVMRKK
ncbi:cation transporting ATPase C-terminal domain-containing protein, partial [Parvimonas micra]